MSNQETKRSKPARLDIGAVIIKHKLCLSDKETIDQIRENPYLQYFVGLPTFGNYGVKGSRASLSLRHIYKVLPHCQEKDKVGEKGWLLHKERKKLIL